MQSRKLQIKQDSIASQARKILESTESARKLAQSKQATEQLLSQISTAQEQFAFEAQFMPVDCDMITSQRALACYALTRFGLKYPERLPAIATYGLQRIGDPDAIADPGYQAEAALLFRAVGRSADMVFQANVLEQLKDKIRGRYGPDSVVRQLAMRAVNEMLTQSTYGDAQMLSSIDSSAMLLSESLNATEGELLEALELVQTIDKKAKVAREMSSMQDLIQRGMKSKNARLNKVSLKLLAKYRDSLDLGCFADALSAMEKTHGAEFKDLFDSAKQQQAAGAEKQNDEQSALDMSGLSGALHDSQQNGDGACEEEEEQEPEESEEMLEVDNAAEIKQSEEELENARIHAEEEERRLAAEREAKLAEEERAKGPMGSLKEYDTIPIRGLTRYLDVQQQLTKSMRGSVAANMPATPSKRLSTVLGFVQLRPQSLESVLQKYSAEPGALGIKDQAIYVAAVSKVQCNELMALPAEMFQVAMNLLLELLKDGFIDQTLPLIVCALEPKDKDPAEQFGSGSQSIQQNNQTQLSLTAIHTAPKRTNLSLTAAQREELSVLLRRVESWHPQKALADKALDLLDS